MNFDHNKFASSLDGISGVVVEKNDDGTYNWEMWNDAAVDLCRALPYSCNDFNYRTWYQEITKMKSETGMLVSCKIDYTRTTGDDHVILLAAFAVTADKPLLIYAQTSVQFHGSSDNNVMSGPISGDDIPQAMYDNLHDQIKDLDFGNVDDSTEGRNSIPSLAQMNLNAMIGAVS
jgi:hypothetical protein